MDYIKLAYEILKYISKLEFTDNKFSYEDFNVDRDVVNEAIRSLDRKGLIDGVFYASNEPYSMHGVSITDKGEDYLKENSSLGKVFSFLKDVKDIIPGL